MMSDVGPDAMYVAGGTDLYPNMKRRQQTPKIVIGLAQLTELRAIQGAPSEGMVLGPPRVRSGSAGCECAARSPCAAPGLKPQWCIADLVNEVWIRSYD